MEDRDAPATLGFTGFRRASMLLSRALTLRCPNCGAHGFLASWFRLAPGCKRCGPRSDRGESDYFLGGMMFNIVLAEGVHVPWSFLQYGAPAAMALAPILLYPFSRLIWLAFDLIVRPVVPNDLTAPPNAR